MVNKGIVHCRSKVWGQYDSFFLFTYFKNVFDHKSYSKNSDSITILNKFFCFMGFKM